MTRRPIRRITILVVLLEAAVAGIALYAGSVIGHSPFSSLTFHRNSLGRHAWAIGVGLVATLPLVLFLPVFLRLKTKTFVELKWLVDRLVVPLFAKCGLLDFAAISLAAGIGEEMLFRGVIQEGVADQLGGRLGLVVGLLVGSAVFGACHWLSRTYAILATVIGVYLGLLLIASDSLLAPIVAHAAYDWAALWYLTRRNKKGGPIGKDRTANTQPDQKLPGRGSKSSV